MHATCAGEAAGAPAAAGQPAPRSATPAPTPTAGPAPPTARASFTAHRAADTATRDICNALLYVIVCGLLTLRLRPFFVSHELATVAACEVATLVVLACALLAPSRYRCCRTGMVLLMRGSLLCRVLAVDSVRLLEYSAPPPGTTTWQAVAHFSVTLLLSSGVLVLGQAAWGLELPPIASAIIQLASVAALAAFNPHLCASSYMQRPLNRGLLGAAFRVLRPALAPLEPLLTVAGIGMGYRNRQCLCVVVGLQFWLALVAPIVLTWHSQLRAYQVWRQQLKQRRRHEIQCAQSTQLLSFPCPCPRDTRGGSRSSGSSGSDSATSSMSEGSLAEVASLFAAGEDVASLIRSRPSTKVPPHPRDWQYEAAVRVQHEFRPSWRHLVLLALMLLHIWAWHLTLFPSEPSPA